MEVEKRRPSFCVSVSPSRPQFYFILEEEWEIALYPRRHQPSGNIDLFNPCLKFRLLKDSHNWLSCSVWCEILSIYRHMAMSIMGKFEHTVEYSPDQIPVQVPVQGTEARSIIGFCRVLIAFWWSEVYWIFSMHWTPCMHVLLPIMETFTYEVSSTWQIFYGHLMMWY